MARYWFGAKLPDWVFASIDDVGGSNDMVQVRGGVEVTFHNAEVGGTPYSDLLDVNGVAVSSVITSDGSDGRAPGTIPPFEGPDGVLEMWASAAGGPRLLIEGRTSQLLAGAASVAAETAQALAAHLAAPNPHVMGTVNLSDVADVTPTAGQILVYDTETGQYLPTTVVGPNPNDFVKTAGGSEVNIGDAVTRFLAVRLPAGDRSGAANTWEIWYNAGSTGSPNWVLVTRFDGYGGLRAQAPRTDRVYGQVRQFSGAQTANLWEFTDAAGNPLSWVDAAGRFRAPNMAISPAWSQDVATAGTGLFRYYNPTPGPLILRGFIVSAGGTAPASGDLIVNPKLDGVAVYSSGNRPRITAGNRTSGLVTNLTTTVWPAGAYLTVDVDSVPSTAPTKITIQAVAY
ncbi:hypothetical protein [Micromonospora sp. NPDC005652]|uniref:hypothetical protein n=1 Tax=Micromonospora sp. NPDC005652 TaxID=3157046 RepID=UPI0033D21C26